METLLDQNELGNWSEKETVKTKKRLVQAYRQAPWRLQTQRGVLLLIVAVLGASVLWVMVSVTVQAASAGLEVQDMEEEKEILQRQIAGMQTEIGNLTSKSVMEERAQQMGFVPVKPVDVSYVIVPGYTGRDPSLNAPPPRSKIQQPLIKPAYTQSLWEWMLEGVITIESLPGGATP